MLNLKKIFKSKTFFIPAFSYIGIIVLLFIGVVLESREILLPTSDMGGLCLWVLIFASLPILMILIKIYWLWQFLNNGSQFLNNGSQSLFLFLLIPIFVYHLLIGFGLGFLTNFIFRHLKSQKPLDIDKTSELAETEPSKRGLNRRKFSTRKIVLVFAVLFILLFAVGGFFVWQRYFFKKSIPLTDPGFSFISYHELKVIFKKQITYDDIADFLSQLNQEYAKTETKKLWRQLGFTLTYAVRVDYNDEKIPAFFDRLVALGILDGLSPYSNIYYGEGFIEIYYPFQFSIDEKKKEKIKKKIQAASRGYETLINEDNSFYLVAFIPFSGYSDQNDQQFQIALMDIIKSISSAPIVEQVIDVLRL